MDQLLKYFERCHDLQDGRTPFLTAAYFGRVKVLKLLHRWGCNTSVRSKVSTAPRNLSQITRPVFLCTCQYFVEANCTPCILLLSGICFRCFRSSSQRCSRSAFVLRWVDEYLEPHEQVARFYAISIADPDTIVTVIRYGKNFKMDQCRGQCYDGASCNDERLS